jgi:hypothetical protein
MASTMDKPKPKPPSVGNRALPCQSRHWLRKGKVHWTRRYSAAEIADNRECDQRQLEGHLGEAELGSLARTILGRPSATAKPALRGRLKNRRVAWACSGVSAPGCI